MSDFFLSVTPSTTTSAKKMAATGNRVSFEGTIDRVLFPKDVEEHLVGAEGRSSSAMSISFSVKPDTGGGFVPFKHKKIEPAICDAGSFLLLLQCV